MSAAWHPKNGVIGVSKEEKMEIDPMFIKEL